MLESLLRSIGVADEMVTNISDTHIAFQRPLWLYALLLVIPAGWFIYTRQKANLATVRRGFRVALTVTRVFVLAILILVLASPVLRLTEEIDKKPILAVVFGVAAGFGYGEELDFHLQEFGKELQFRICSIP